jgi:hypothetical protein
MSVLNLSVPHSLSWLHAKPQAQILSSGVLLTFVWNRTQLQSIQTPGKVCFSVKAGRRRTSQHPWRSKEAFCSPLDRPRVLIRSCKTAAHCVYTTVDVLPNKQCYDGPATAALSLCLCLCLCFPSSLASVHTKCRHNNRKCIFISARISCRLLSSFTATVSRRRTWYNIYFVKKMWHHRKVFVVGTRWRSGQPFYNELLGSVNTYVSMHIVV